MGFKLREIEAESKFCRELTLDAIAQAVPVAEVQAVLAETGVCEQRERKLNMVVTVLADDCHEHLHVAPPLAR